MANSSFNNRTFAVLAATATTGITVAGLLTGFYIANADATPSASAKVAENAKNITSEAKATMQHRMDQQQAESEAENDADKATYYGNKYASATTISGTLRYGAAAVNNKAAEAWDKTRAQYHKKMGDYHSQKLQQAVSTTIGNE